MPKNPQPKKPSVQFNKTPAEILRDRNAKAMADVKKQRQPLGGAPPVKIPPLNAQAIEGGGTMEDQAAVLQDPTSPLSPTYNPQLARMQQDGRFSALPPAAKDDPNFLPGVGSMIAGNQPFIGQRQNVGSAGRPDLSQETKDGLQALGDFYAKASKVQQEAVQQPEQQRPDQIEQPSEEGLDEDLDNTRQEIEDILASTQQYNILTDPDRRKRIENDLKPMDVTDIIVHGELRQTVPLLENLSVIFRTVSADEDLEIKRLMYGMKGGDLYMGGRYDTMQLALALVGVNERELPSHLDKEGDFKKDLFQAKYRLVLKFPVQLIADFCVQYGWFDERVRMMLAGQTEALKNT
jgi:hypothetical protein